MVRTTVPLSASWHYGRCRAALYLFASAAKWVMMVPGYPTRTTGPTCELSLKLQGACGYDRQKRTSGGFCSIFQTPLLGGPVRNYFICSRRFDSAHSRVPVWFLDSVKSYCFQARFVDDKTRRGARVAHAAVLRAQERKCRFAWGASTPTAISSRDAWKLIRVPDGCRKHKLRLLP